MMIRIARLLPVAFLALAPAQAVTGGDSAPKLISTTGGDGADGDAKTWNGFHALQKAAEQNDPDALYELGLRYLQGTPETPKNITRALLHLGDAARLGQRDAHFRLGKLHADGVETPQNHAKALVHYTAAARAGDPIAQHNIGALLSSGGGVKRDYPEALAWLILAARQNSDAAESEKKLRGFLARYPKAIAAGEARAQALEQEFATAKNAPSPPASAPATKPAPIKIDIAPMPSPALHPMPITPLPAPASTFG